MPIIQCNMLEGRTREQKHELARRITEVVVDVLDVSPESVRILIHQMGLDDFSVAGITAAERRNNYGSRQPGAHDTDGDDDIHA